MTEALDHPTRDAILVAAEGAGNRGADLVTFVLKQVENVVSAGTDPLPVVQQLYIELMLRRGQDHQQARNSWASASGRKFEVTIRASLNAGLASKGIRAESIADLVRYSKHLKSFLMLPARRRRVQESFDALPDNDIMLVTRSRPAAEPGKERVVLFGILSCKTSLRERAMQSCFWALATRDTGVRMGLVTQDRDHELGTCGRPTKIRKLLEAYFDRVFTQNTKTALCGQIRPFDEIFDDVERWRRDVARDYVLSPWHL